MKAATNGAVILVAARRAAVAKSRLAGALSAELRRDLVRAMLDDVLTAARAAHAGDLVVVTPDDDYRALAERHGARLLLDDGTGFNAAICTALADPSVRRASAALVMPADLPQLEAADVRCVLDALAAVDVVLVPSGDGGTAALGLRPPDRMAPCFGVASADAHRAQAARAALVLRELRPRSLAADVDEPADLLAVRDRVGAATRAVVARLPASWPLLEANR
ncbi:MAG: 2-phospho-L-lactate guanylyltransferase [Dehalococcoidia bacterium]|nr:2-phospho-L-lactate guanylyltransferase [Dehalococcoidia bacterium]